ncbi:hypothetical protein GYMC52_3637 (plasmid) [Geobacillus sp. Y412MC52]|nr:hypothetical protein GYMC52_3637 [Geobacillus sp. Y412MC52]
MNEARAGLPGWPPPGLGPSGWSLGKPGARFVRRSCLRAHSSATVRSVVEEANAWHRCLKQRIIKRISDDKNNGVYIKIIKTINKRLFHLFFQQTKVSWFTRSFHFRVVRRSCSRSSAFLPLPAAVRSKIKRPIKAPPWGEIKTCRKTSLNGLFWRFGALEV